MNLPSHSTSASKQWQPGIHWPYLSYAVTRVVIAVIPCRATAPSSSSTSLQRVLDAWFCQEWLRG